MPGNEVWSLVAALILLVALAAGLAGWARLGLSRGVLTATVRAVIQLLAVGAVIGAIFRTPVLAPLYLLLMLVAAAWTSGRRLLAAGARPGRGLGGGLRGGWRGGYHGGPILAAALAIAAGAGTSGLVIFACRAIPFEARTLVPTLAQLIGGSMTASTLAGQRLLDDVNAGWDEVEGWLALGATSRQAVLEPARRAAARALVPALDQTRNVGLVVLPGAFVGLLLGGATPFEAGRVQLLVLVGLISAETFAAVVVTALLSYQAGWTRPVKAEGKAGAG